MTFGNDSVRRISHHQGKGTQQWNQATFNIVGQWSLPLQRWCQRYKLSRSWYLWHMCRGGASGSRAHGKRTPPRNDNNDGTNATGTATTRRQWTEKRLTIGLPVHGCTWSKYTSDQTSRFLGTNGSGRRQHKCMTNCSGLKLNVQLVLCVTVHACM